METTKTDAAITDDVLHIENKSKLSPAAIAKAVAHHEKNHKGDQKHDESASGKKTEAGKSKSK